MTEREELLKAAEDLADAFDIPVEAAVAKLRYTLSGELAPLRRFRRMPWYLRLPMPLRWRQRWIYWQLHK